MEKLTLILALLALASCRTHAKAVSADRHADSVAQLRSLSSRLLERETVVETLVMRPDTAGVLRVVERGVRRTAVRETESTSDTSSVAVASSSVAVETVRESATPGTDRPSRPWAVGLSLWVSLSILAATLAAYLLKTWTSRK